MAGKPEAFTPEENAALRAALVEYKASTGLSDREIGDQIGIEQQNVSAKRKSGGFSRPTAIALVKQLGYPTVEDFLAEKGVLAALKPAPQGSAWGDRDMAVRIASAMKLDPGAVDAVVKRHTDPAAKHWPCKRWVDKFIAEDKEWELDGRAGKAPPAPKSRPGKQPKVDAEERRRRAG